MTTAIGVMDTPHLEGNTDVLVIADAEAKVLCWIPRDLWCEGIRQRVNSAFLVGGHEALASTLREHGFELDASLMVDRRAAERALEDVRLHVPVAERLEFWYPLQPDRPIEEGRKRISFEPPGEILEGERLHQWAGARYSVSGKGSDLDRIERQQTMAKAMFEQGFDFRRAIEVDAQVAISGPALEELRRVDSSFFVTTFAREAVARTIDGKDVLVL